MTGATDSVAVTCLYNLTARSDMCKAMAQSLVLLEQEVRACSGCLGTTLLTDIGDATLFVFIEHWRTQEDREAAGAVLGKSLFAPIMAAAMTPPARRLLARPST